MTNKEFQEFLASIISQDYTSPYFGNLVRLAKHDINNYSGPKTEDEFYHRVKTWTHYSHNSQYLDKTLLDLYTGVKLKDKQIQKCLKWVIFLSPLVALREQLPGLLSGTKYSEIDCYNTIICYINRFTDQKLKYDVLSKIINKYRNKTNLPEDFQMIYELACFFRSVCSYADTQNPEIQENKIQDLRVVIQTANPANVKLDNAKKIVEILRKKLEKTVKNTDFDIESAVKKVCDQAYAYAAEAGAANQDFVNNVWDDFDYHKIMDVPRVAQKAMNRRDE